MAKNLDPRFPSLHRVHPRGWINDPNGIVRVGERWHVFFQYNPRSARHEHICWGHMSSKDLVTWREEPLGPQPRLGQADQDGCWSGIGVIDRAQDQAGVPTLVYSGVDGVENQLSRVIVSRMDAGATELVEPGVVVAGIPELDGLIGVRDPFVFEHDGRRWAVQGAGIQEEGGYVPALLLYSCDDLDNWEYVGPLLRGDHPVAAQHAPADLWECPQLVQIGEQWVVLLSLWRHPDTVERSTIEVNYLAGDLTPNADGAPRFEPTGGGRVDLGPDFYAPQAVLDESRPRVLMWGWSWEGLDRSQVQTDAQGWAGVLTFPRELRLCDGALLAAVPTELNELRSATLEIAPGDGQGAVLDLPVPARVEVRSRDRLRVEIVSAGGTTTAVVAFDEGPATLFLDGSLLELIPQHATPCTMRFYPEAGDLVRVRGDLEAAWALELPEAGS